LTLREPLTGGAQTSEELALKCGKLGAFDYITKGVKLEGEILLDRIERAIKFRDEIIKVEELTTENTYLNREIKKLNDFEMIGQHESIEHVRKLIDAAAGVKKTILITGENGVGKELVARAINQKTKLNGKTRTFLCQNIAAMSEGLIERELFGNVKGAYTGAISDKKGLIEAAGIGDLFLDEIGEISKELQAKLLRVVEYGDYKPLGTSVFKKAKCRFIFATNKDLKKEIKKGNFREDLFYRMSFEIKVPPLRQRKEDIELLANHFLKKISREQKKRIKGFSKTAMSELMAYHWPGNIRELCNCIERAVIMARKYTQIGPGLLKMNASKLPIQFNDYEEIRGKRAEAEKALIERALRLSNGNKVLAAQHCGMHRSVLYRRMKEYNISLPE